MRDSWRLSGIAVALVVLLRIAIGWQFLYEGLWKLNTFSSAKPWTSAGYLRAAHGPLRNAYRGMTGDPDDLRWLDYDEVASGLDSYRSRFLAHNPDLTDDQKSQLDTMLDGPAQFSVRLDHLPAGLKFEGNLKKVISYDPEAKRLIVDGKLHFLPKERFDLEKQARALKSASKADVDRFVKALDQVFKLSSRLSYKERLAVLLKIDPERVGLVYRDDKTKEVVEQRKGKITEYMELLSRYNEQLPQARETFEHKHLETQWDEIQKLRSNLVTPVRALEADFRLDAQAADRRAAGSRAGSRAVDRPAADRSSDDLDANRSRMPADGGPVFAAFGARRCHSSALILSRDSALARRRRADRDGRARAQFHHQ